MTHRNDKIYQERRKRKFNCFCGGKYTYSHRKRHIESNKHQEYLEIQKEMMNKEVKEHLEKSYKKYFIIIL